MDDYIYIYIYTSMEKKIEKQKLENKQSFATLYIYQNVAKDFLFKVNRLKKNLHAQHSIHEIEFRDRDRFYKFCININ